ncbi:type VII secretion protein EssB/YukC [Thermoflavimicrobium dichotomicum]|uniref:WXG100 protein secretion system (Wss), protein YukC n=1 Tax=Thermoflavimicrobium dichotomicum TaxID=46223 RepID=A0A1I3K6V4_9BACL|nr:type VII secretion protein EssB/YukC [Thermoflavimicrobium dichotomicum]SFI68251.1 WXG100 protein secretion system (Wss), protein YukC [Thermoflavimicrobium dichotomicum]
MRRFSFNQGTLVFDRNKVYFEIPVKNTYVNSLEEVIPIIDLYDEGMAFDCTIEHKYDEDKLVLDFLVEPGYLPLNRVQIEGTKELKLAISEKLIAIAKYFEGQTELQTVFKPINFFANDKGEIKILYRGVKDILPSEGYTEESVYDQIKRLILWLFCSARFDELRINGFQFANQRIIEEHRRIIKRVIHAKTYDELLTVIAKEKEEIQKEKLMVEENSSQDSSKVQKRLKVNLAQVNPFNKWVKVVALVSAAAVLFVAYGYLFDTTEASNITHENKPVQKDKIVSSIPSTPLKKTEVSPESNNPSLLKGLRLAAQHLYEEATKEFDQVDYKKLNKEDRQIVLFSYLMAGRAQKAIDLEPAFIKSVVDYYVKTNNVEGMNKLKSNDPLVQFEKAVINKDLDEIIKLEKQIPRDDRRNRIIVNAHMLKMDFTGAYAFAEEIKDIKLMIYVKEKEKEMVQKLNISEQEKKVKTEEIEKSIHHLKKMVT